MAQLSRVKMWLLERMLGATEAEIRLPYTNVNWITAVKSFSKPDFKYPSYYQLDFHGVPGGYLQPDAAISYDPITAKIVMPNEIMVRNTFVTHVKSLIGNKEPSRILDMGVGTGTSALFWNKAFPEGEIVGIDPSPYMLVAASMKLKDKNVQLAQALAEDTNFSPASFDLVTATFLFHELPQTATRQVLNHAFSLLKPGGTLAILDGRQPGNLLVKAIGGYFPEPYMKEYLSNNLSFVCRELGFSHINVRRHLTLYQFVTAIRPSL